MTKNVRRLGFLGVVSSGALSAFSCVPLRDLGSLSENYGKTNGSGGADASGGNGGEGPGGATGSCGDGVVGGGEACDSGGLQTKDCEADCRKPVCGDGVENPRSGEVCDEGGANRDCFSCGDEEQPCPEGCTCDWWGSHLYAFCSPSKTFEEAKALCSEAGFAPVALESLAEENFVASRATALAYQEFWLGGTDEAQEGQWRWVATDQLFFSGVAPEGTTQSGAYSHFAKDEPNDVNASQNCLIYGTLNDAWLDASCPEVRFPVCELAPEKPRCGNGELDAGEACDTKVETETCDEDCTMSFCGDGITNEASGELCDDANTDELDGCREDCKLSGLLVHLPLSEKRGKIAFDRGLFGINAKVTGGNVLDDAEGATFYSPSYAEMTSSRLLFSDFTISVGLKTSSWTGGIYYLTRDVLGTSSFHMRITGTEFEVYGIDEFGTRHPSATDALRLSGASGENGDGSKFIHFAYSCSEGNWKAYRKGVKIAEVSDPEGMCRPPKGASTFVLGADDDFGSNYLTGVMKEFRIYDRALTDKEIMALATKVDPQ